MDLKTLLIFTLSVLFQINWAHSLFFHMKETERKCFIEEVPDETLVIGKYKVEVYEPHSNTYLPTPHGIGMHVEVTDPQEKIVISKLFSTEGRFTFTSHMPGEHKICLYSNSTAWFGGGTLRIHLSMEVGENAFDYNELANKEKLTELQLRIRQLLDHVEHISKEQNYQRYREERFRQTSESTNERVLWWSIAQVTILVLTGFFQMRHLKKFFQAKKLV